MEPAEIRQQARDKIRAAGETVARKTGAFAGEKLAKAITRLLGGEEDKSREPGYISSLTQLAGAEAVKTAAESPELQQTGADYIADQISDVGTAIRDETKPLLQETADKISPDKRPVYQQIKERLQKPSDSVIKKLAVGFTSRLLSFGVQATSYVSAAFVDRLTGKNERVDNQNSFQRIFTRILTTILPNRGGTPPVAPAPAAPAPTATTP